MTPISLAAVNAMTPADFVAAFGGIAEHSPWVAEAAATRRPFATRAAMIDAFQAAVGEASAERQRALLVAHPDLAGRAAIAGDLTADSKREQAGAGLDRLTAEEFARFTALNTRLPRALRHPVHLCRPRRRQAQDPGRVRGADRQPAGRRARDRAGAGLPHRRLPP